MIFDGLYNIKDIDSHYFRKTTLSFIPQKIRFKDLTVKEVLSENIKFKDSSELFEFLEKSSIFITEEIFTFIEKNWNRPVNNLSGGRKQIISIIRALTKNSSLLIFDEPTSNLDEQNINWFNLLIHSIKKDKIILVVTHGDLDIFDSIVYL